MPSSAENSENFARQTMENEENMHNGEELTTKLDPLPTYIKQGEEEAVVSSERIPRRPDRRNSYGRRARSLSSSRQLSMSNENRASNQRIASREGRPDRLSSRRASIASSNSVDYVSRSRSRSSMRRSSKSPNPSKPTGRPDPTARVQRLSRRRDSLRCSQQSGNNEIVDSIYGEGATQGRRRENSVTRGPSPELSRLEKGSMRRQSLGYSNQSGNDERVDTIRTKKRRGSVGSSPSSRNSKSNVHVSNNENQMARRQSLGYGDAPGNNESVASKSSNERRTRRGSSDLSQSPGFSENSIDSSNNESQSSRRKSLGYRDAQGKNESLSSTNNTPERRKRRVSSDHSQISKNSSHSNNNENRSRRRQSVDRRKGRESSHRRRSVGPCELGKQNSVVDNSTGVQLVKREHRNRSRSWNDADWSKMLTEQNQDKLESSVDSSNNENRPKRRQSLGYYEGNNENLSSTSHSQERRKRRGSSDHTQISKNSSYSNNSENRLRRRQSVDRRDGQGSSRRGQSVGRCEIPEHKLNVENSTDVQLMKQESRSWNDADWSEMLSKQNQEDLADSFTDDAPLQSHARDDKTAEEENPETLKCDPDTWIVTKDGIFPSYAVPIPEKPVARGYIELTNVLPAIKRNLENHRLMKSKSKKLTKSEKLGTEITGELFGNLVHLKEQKKMEADEIKPQDIMNQATRHPVEKQSGLEYEEVSTRRSRPTRRCSGAAGNPDFFVKNMSRRRLSNDSCTGEHAARGQSCERPWTNRIRRMSATAA